MKTRTTNSHVLTVARLVDNLDTTLHGGLHLI